MTLSTKPSPEAIRLARQENPKMRERDFAQKLEISEADYLSAYIGADDDALKVQRVRADVEAFLGGISAVGEVMALTRNESAVHEKIGPYEKTVPGKHAAMVLGKQIDLRIFPSQWAEAFAVEKHGGDSVRRSLQFFNASGEAVHKVHLREASNLDAYAELLKNLASDNQSSEFHAVAPKAKAETAVTAEVDSEAFRSRWSELTDVHQFIGLLRDFNIDRKQAVELAGESFAWPLDTGSVQSMMEQAGKTSLPIMCFVGNRGCIQIHTGAITGIKMMGPWLNVMDPTFHLHLRTDRISEVWAVRKPTKDGHVTSLEVFDANGELFIQFFGERHEGTAERADWRELVESLLRLPRSVAA